MWLNSDLRSHMWSWIRYSIYLIFFLFFFPIQPWSKQSFQNSGDFYISLDFWHPDILAENCFCESHSPLRAPSLHPDTPPRRKSSRSSGKKSHHEKKYYVIISWWLCCTSAYKRNWRGWLRWPPCLLLHDCVPRVMSFDTLLFCACGSVQDHAVHTLVLATSEK